MLQEREEELIGAVENDLHKHKVEIVSAEIAPVLGEIEFMLKVMMIGNLKRIDVVSLKSVS